jgi:hypothetical protein
MPEQARLHTVARYLMLASSLLPALLVAVFIVGRWPEYWKWIASEDTPMTTLEVSVMYATALACWGAAVTDYLRGGSDFVRRWTLLGAGFLWLAMDDRFAIHERIRDGFLAPHDIRIPGLPVGPGDFILIVYLLAGLALQPWLLPLWRRHAAARRRFLAGVAVAATAVLLDAYDIHSLDLAGQRLEQTLEECLELVAQVLFLQGVLLAWLEAVISPPTSASATDVAA